VPGITTSVLLRSFRSRLSTTKSNITKEKIFGADVVIIDVGRNDYWKHADANATVRNIARLASYFGHIIELANGHRPLLVVATLLPTTRLYQRPFIDSVNLKLIARSASLAKLTAKLPTNVSNAQAAVDISLPVPSERFSTGIRFDKLPTTVLGKDGCILRRVGTRL